MKRCSECNLYKSNKKNNSEYTINYNYIHITSDSLLQEYANKTYFEPTHITLFFVGFDKNIKNLDLSPLKVLINNPLISFSQIIISNRKLDDNSVKYIAEIIKKNTIYELTLINNNVYSNISIILNALRYNSSIKHLTINSNNLDDKNLSLLCSILKSNKTIDILDIGNNKFTDLTLLGDILKYYNNSIETLDIFNMHILKSSLVYFLNSLGFNKTIKSIYNIHNLINSNVNTFDFNVLLPLKNNKTIKNLKINDEIDNKTMKVNFKVLLKIIKNKQINEIRLDNCECDNFEDVKTFFKTLQKLDNVQSLIMHNVNIFNITNLSSLYKYIETSSNLLKLDITYNLYNKLNILNFEKH